MAEIEGGELCNIHDLIAKLSAQVVFVPEASWNVAPN